MDAPPLLVGAFQVTAMMPLAEVAATVVGAVGGPTGLTAADGELDVDVPATFVAFTVNVYEVPFVSPVTTQVRAPVVVHVFAPPDDVIVYPVIGEPPSDPGAAHVTVACPLPGMATTDPGAAGTVRGVTMTLGAEVSDGAVADDAITVTV